MHLIYRGPAIIAMTGRSDQHISPLICHVKHNQRLCVMHVRCNHRRGVSEILLPCGIHACVCSETEDFCCSHPTVHVQKYVPLDLRPKKTRAIRKRMTKHQVSILESLTVCVSKSGQYVLLEVIFCHVQAAKVIFCHVQTANCLHSICVWSQVFRYTLRILCIPCVHPFSDVSLGKLCCCLTTAKYCSQFVAIKRCSCPEVAVTLCSKPTS